MLEFVSEQSYEVRNPLQQGRINLLSFLDLICQQDMKRYDVFK